MASTKVLSTRIQLRRDTLESFEKVGSTLILAAGEPAVVLASDAPGADNSKAFMFKIGNGVTVWNDLPWANSVGSGGSTEVKVDSKSIIMNATGEVALNGFSEAAQNYIPYKTSAGELGWMPIPDGSGADLAELVTKVDENTGKITELETKLSELENKLIDDYYTKTEVDSKLSSAYTPGETFEDVSQLPSPPTTADVGVIHPIINGGTATEDFVNPGATIDPGDQVVAVKQPDGTIKYDILPGGVLDVSSLQEQVEKNTLDIATNKNNIATNTQTIDNVRTNLLNNYYTKPEVDAKIGSIYHPAPGVDNITDLPPIENLKPGTTIPVENGGTATDDFVKPGEQIPAGSTIVVVEDADGNKKFDVLPPAEAPDLSAYATKTELTEGLATKVSSITAGGTTVLTKVDGTVDIPMATKVALGLVKSSDADGFVSVQTDGTLKVNSISIEDVFVPDDLDVSISGGNASGN